MSVGIVDGRKMHVSEKMKKRTFPVDCVGCGMNGSRWSQLAMLRGNTGRLESSGGRGDSGRAVHHRRAAVPRVGAAMPRLTAEQSAVDVARSGRTQVRTAALLGVSTEVAQDTVDRRHLANQHRNSSY